MLVWSIVLKDLTHHACLDVARCRTKSYAVTKGAWDFKRRQFPWSPRATTIYTLPTTDSCSITMLMTASRWT